MGGARYVDMFSPEYDNPQRLSRVAEMFEHGGAEVTYAGYIDARSGRAAVVRGKKRTLPASAIALMSS